jgi:hypothetical protein
MRYGSFFSIGLFSFLLTSSCSVISNDQNSLADACQLPAEQIGADPKFVQFSSSEGFFLAEVPGSELRVQYEATGDEIDATPGGCLGLPSAQNSDKILVVKRLGANEGVILQTGDLAQQSDRLQKVALKPYDYTPLKKSCGDLLVTNQSRLAFPLANTGFEIFDAGTGRRTGQFRTQFSQGSYQVGANYIFARPNSNSQFIDIWSMYGRPLNRMTIGSDEFSAIRISQDDKVAQLTAGEYLIVESHQNHIAPSFQVKRGQFNSLARNGNVVYVKAFQRLTNSYPGRTLPDRTGFGGNTICRVVDNREWQYHGFSSQSGHPRQTVGIC